MTQSPSRVLSRTSVQQNLQMLKIDDRLFWAENLALSDFWPFDHMKTSLVGQTFDEPEQRLEAITEF
jgi:hypothetical protein